MDGQHATVAAIVAVVWLMQSSCAPPDRDAVFDHPPESTYVVSTGRLQYGDIIAEVQAAQVTTQFFTVVDRRPWLGRIFLPQDFVMPAEPVALLSHQLWDQQLGGKPQIIGGTLQLDGGDHTVIGVMPPGIEWPPGIGLWIPQISPVP